MQRFAFMIYSSITGEHFLKGFTYDIIKGDLGMNSKIGTG